MSLTTLAPGLGKDMLDGSTASLARELAQNIRPIEAILPDYGYTGLEDPRWQEITSLPEFSRLLESAQREWNTADSTSKRVRTKALASLELWLADLHHIMASPNTDTKTRLEAGKIMMKLAGMDGVGSGNGGMRDESGSGMKIVINIGDSKVEKVLSPVIEHAENEGDDA